MSAGGIYVKGLREYTRAMEKAGVELDDLKDVMAEIAQEATNTMQPFIPVRSGALRSSARGNRAKGKAVVTIGKARTPYAGPIQWGWPKRNIRGAGFVQRTDAIMETKTPQMLEDGWDRITQKYGLS